MKRHSLDLVAVVALFCVYTASAILLCLIGAEVYRNTADTMRHNFDERTSVLYVAEKLRQNDITGSVRIDSVNGSDALVLVEKRSGRDFETWIFVQDRILYEGVFAPDAEVDIALCQSIMPMDKMTVDTSGSDGGLLRVSFGTVDGREMSTEFWLRSERSGAAAVGATALAAAPGAATVGAVALAAAPGATALGMVAPGAATPGATALGTTATIGGGRQ